MHALVSVIITTYNRLALAQRAVASALAQTYAPVEVIVVEDGSDTGFEAWLRAEALEQVRYVRHETNLGLAAARNTGLRLARGEYVAYLDDDDEWTADKIARQVALFEERDDRERVAVVYCGRRVLAGVDSSEAEVHPQVRGNVRAYIREHGLFTVSSSNLFRRDLLAAIGGHDEILRSHVDFDLWMKLARANYETDFVDDCLVVSRPHAGIRMMRDPKPRLAATEQFVNKWFPEWVDWFGPKRARAYRAEFSEMVLQSLADVHMDRNDVVGAARVYLRIITTSPGRMRSYAHLRRFATQIVHNLPHGAR